MRNRGGDHSTNPRQGRSRRFGRVLRTAGNALAREAARLWEENPDLREQLSATADREQTRERLFAILDRKERELLWNNVDMHPLERSLSARANRMLKDTFAPINEARTGASAVDSLWRLARGDEQGIRAGFATEFRHFLRAVNGRTNIYGDAPDDPTKLRGRRAASERTARVSSPNAFSSSPMVSYTTARLYAVSGHFGSNFRIFSNSFAASGKRFSRL